MPIFSCISTEVPSSTNIPPASRKRNKRLMDFFAVPVGQSNPKTAHLKPGIYRKVAGGIQPVVIFVPMPHYRGGRLNPMRTVGNVWTKTFPGAFNKALEDAIVTARKG